MALLFPLQVWLPVPCFMILLSVFLVVAPMVFVPEQAITSAIALSITLLGLPIYFFLAWDRFRLKIFDTISGQCGLLTYKEIDGDDMVLIPEHSFYA